MTPIRGTVTLTSGGYAANIPFQPISTVILTESGLALGTPWTAVFGGVQESYETISILFNVPAGTCRYQVPSVPGVARQPFGSVTVTGAYTLMFGPTAIPIATSAVNLSEGGLPTSTIWGATINSVTQLSRGTSLDRYLSNGLCAYAFNAVPGAPVSLAATYFPPAMYSVTLSETGLSADTTWSATVDGLTETMAGLSPVFSP